MEIMTRILLILAAAIGLGLGIAFLLSDVESDPDIPLLAVVDYRSLDGGADGIAIVDVTPNMPSFGEILQVVPVSVGATMHHPFMNRDGTKLYSTALGGDRLYYIDLREGHIEGVIPIDTGDCAVGEDMYFSKDGSKYYLTCMGSDRVVVFDSNTDLIIDEIMAPFPDEPFIHYPHGISADEDIDRMIVTETISADLSDPGGHVSIIELSTGEVLQNISLMKVPGSPGAPVEVIFYPGRPVAYVTGMLDASLWVLVWDSASKEFLPKLVDDGEPRGESWPLATVIGPDGNLYVSWAVPGIVNVYSLAKIDEPELIRTIPTDAGSHHIDFSPDGKIMFVQSNLLNLDGINAGTIVAIDLESGEKLGTITSLRDQGMLPESMLLLGGAGHGH
jgi:hypothetical protein